MGMDLFATRPRSARARQGLSTNRWIWGALGHLLVQLGCDTSEMTTTNDGQRVRAATCKLWATALRRAMRDVRRIELADAPERVILCLVGKEQSALSLLFPRHRKVARSQYETIALDHDELQELREFCQFFETCGGLRQW